MWLRGDQLTDAQRAAACAMFGYRWTIENHARSIAWHGSLSTPHDPPSQTDNAWIAAHCFNVTKSGHVVGRHARPAFMADTFKSP